MLRISGIRAGLDEDTTEYLRMAAAKTLHVPPERIAALTIAKKSVDARKKARRTLCLQRGRHANGRRQNTAACG